MLKMLRLFTLSVILQVSIFAQDECASIGWANYDGTTFVGPPTGGGNAVPVIVTTFAELKAQGESSDPKVIYIKGTLGNGYQNREGDRLSIKSNKTIIGLPGATLKAAIVISGQSNIILRNVTLLGPGSNDLQAWDAVSIQDGGKRIWVDHCEFMNGQDGTFDITKGSDNVSVTYCIFRYTIPGNHNLATLIGGSDTETESHGKLHVTFQYCWWDASRERTPRTRYGQIHVANCYFTNADPSSGLLTSQEGAAAGLMANLRVENCHFVGIKDPVRLKTGTTEGIAFSKDNLFTNCSGTTTTQTAGGYTVFTPPYPITLAPASEVKALVTDPKCGAGSNMPDPTTCACPLVSSLQDDKKIFTQIYPNPSNSSFTLNAKEEVKAMYIVDVHGVVVYEMGNISAQKSIEITPSIPTGTYLIQLQYASGVKESIKFVKTK